MRDRRVWPIPRCRFVAHRVRSHNNWGIHRAFLVGAHPVGDRGASPLPRCRLFAHWVRSYKETEALRLAYNHSRLPVNTMVSHSTRISLPNRCAISLRTSSIASIVPSGREGSTRMWMSMKRMRPILAT